MLAALARHYHWSRAELEALTAPEMQFWLGCAGMLNERMRRESGE
ncbi:MAG: hypothetical protein ACYCZB_18285 [Acidiphilium sp.]